MRIEHKDASIVPTGGDDDFPGTFEVVLSAPTKDRDGDTLLPEEWKQPLPDHITFDADHGMTVATTVGSGAPRIDKDTGNLVVSGSYSSLPRAQDVRTLVNEGHIRTTSVAFMTEKTEKDGKKGTVRELLNGAFVSIPSNREALVLSSKAGARNSSTDMGMIQAIHDNSADLGAMCGKSLARAAAAAAGFLTMAEARAVLDPAEPAGDPAPNVDPGTLALAVDAAIDQALVLLANTDLTTLPAEVQQAIALIQTADAAADDLLDALGVPDPDEDKSASPAAASTAVPAKAATPAETSAAADDELRMRVRVLTLSASTYTD